MRTGGWNAAPMILRRGNGSCSEYSFLLMAVLRANGVPALCGGAGGEGGRRVVGRRVPPLGRDLCAGRCSVVEDGVAEGSPVNSATASTGAE